MDPVPKIRLDRSAAAPLTEQLVAQLRCAVLAGELVPGDRLPSTRRLAEALGVSRTVVVGAYEQLLGEAFLDSAPGSGTRVSAELPGWIAREEPQRAHAVDGRPRPRSRADEPIRLETGRPVVSAEPPRDWVRALSRAARLPWLTESVDPRGDEAG